jgi:hypothetical protein
MQRYTMFFIVVSALHVSCGFSAHHEELKNLCVVTASMVESDSTRLAITTHKFDKYRCCIYSFWAPDDERKTRSKHADHWQQ